MSLKSGVKMSEKRFTYTNGDIKDNESKGDTNLLYKLNSDEGRLELVEFMNAREQMITSLNDEIKRLWDLIEEHATDSSNLKRELRKQTRISNSYKEMTQLLMELIGEIEK